MAADGVVENASTAVPTFFQSSAAAASSVADHWKLIIMLLSKSARGAEEGRRR